MKSNLCELCHTGPIDATGHRNLVRHLCANAVLGASAVHFRCIQCSTEWARNYVGDGLFLWDLAMYPRASPSGSFRPLIVVPGTH